MKLRFLILLLLIGCTTPHDYQNLSEVTHLEEFTPTPFSPPLETKEEVASFFLQQEDVKKEISQDGNWWIRVSRLEPHDDLWVAILGAGEDECSSPRQCHMHIYNGGTIKKSLVCSDGWDCW